jgi:hypothetical protein
MMERIIVYESNGRTKFAKFRGSAKDLILDIVKLADYGLEGYGYFSIFREDDFKKYVLPFYLKYRDFSRLKEEDFWKVIEKLRRLLERVRHLEITVKYIVALRSRLAKPKAAVEFTRGLFGTLGKVLELDEADRLILDIYNRITDCRDRAIPKTECPVGLSFFFYSGEGFDFILFKNKLISLEKLERREVKMIDLQELSQIYDESVLEKILTRISQ